MSASIVYTIVCLLALIPLLINCLVLYRDVKMFVDAKRKVEFEREREEFTENHSNCCHCHCEDNEDYEGDDDCE